MSNTQIENFVGLVEHVNFSAWKRAFENHERYSTYTDAGHRSLFDYFDQLADDLSVAIELDVIAICSDYAEYENLAEFNDMHSENYNCITELMQDTVLIPVESSALKMIDGEWKKSPEHSQSFIIRHMRG